MADNEEKDIPPSNIDAEEDQTVKIVRPKKPQGAKVVLESGTDSAIRPSDSTTMAPSPLASSSGDIKGDAPGLVEVSQPTDVDEDVDDQTTKIPAMKPPPKPQGVKLNPAPKAPPPPTMDESAEETVAMDRDDVDIAPAVSKKESGADDQTAKIPPIKKPGADTAPKQEEAKKPETPAVPKPKPPTPPPAEAANTPKKAKTIKLTPLGMGADDDDNAEETLSLDRSSVMNEGMPSSLGGAAPKAPETPKAASKEDDESTVKISKAPATPPKPTEAAAAPPKKDEKAKDDDTVKVDKPTEDSKDEPTVKIGKPPIPEQATPSVPGAKETIKLRPSTATTPPPPKPAGAKPTAASTIKVKPPSETGEAPAAGGVSKKTIRLVPKKKEDAASSAQPNSVKPSSPTVKLPDASDDNSGKSSKKTLKINRPESGAPPPPDKTDASESAAAVAAAEEVAADDKSAEPGIVLTLVACVAFLLLIYLGLLIGGQWAHNEQDADFDYQYIFLKDAVLQPGQAPPR